VCAWSAAFSSRWSIFALDSLAIKDVKDIIVHKFDSDVDSTPGDQELVHGGRVTGFSSFFPCLSDPLYISLHCLSPVFFLSIFLTCLTPFLLAPFELGLGHVSGEINTC